MGYIASPTLTNTPIVIKSIVYENDKGVIKLSGVLSDYAHVWFKNKCFKTISLSSAVTHINSGTFSYTLDNFTDLYLNSNNIVDISSADYSLKDVNIHVLTELLEEYKNSYPNLASNFVGLDSVEDQPADEIWYTAIPDEDHFPTKKPQFSAISEDLISFIDGNEIIAYNYTYNEGDDTGRGEIIFKDVISCADLGTINTIDRDSFAFTKLQFPESALLISLDFAKGSRLSYNNYNSLFVDSESVVTHGSNVLAYIRFSIHDHLNNGSVQKFKLADNLLFTYISGQQNLWTDDNATNSLFVKTYLGYTKMNHFYKYWANSASIKFWNPEKGEYTKLTRLNPEDLKHMNTIDTRQFANFDQLEYVHIPGNITSIESCAFSGCSSLTTLLLDEGIVSIYPDAFENCKSLKEVVIPSTVTGVDNVFPGTPIEKITFRQCYDVYSNDSTSGEPLITGGTTIFSYAYRHPVSSNMYSVTPNFSNVTLYNEIPTSGRWPFSSQERWNFCEGYATSEYWKELKAENLSTKYNFVIGKASLLNNGLQIVVPPCTNYTDKNTGNPKNYYKESINKKLIAHDNKYYAYAGTGYVTENDIEYAYGIYLEVDDWASHVTTDDYITDKMKENEDYKIYFDSVDDNIIEFSCTHTSSKDLGMNNVCEVRECEVEWDAKYNDYKFVIQFDRPITYINSQIFQGNNKLKRVYLPEIIIEIKDRAFSNCVGLESVNIPHNTTYIGECAFEECYSVKEFDIHPEVLSIGKSAFKNCTGKLRIASPTIMKISNYSNGNDWFEYSKFVELEVYGNDIDVIGDRPIMDFGTLKRITVNTPNLKEYGTILSTAVLDELILPSHKFDRFVHTGGAFPICYGGAKYIDLGGLTTIGIPNSETRDFWGSYVNTVVKLGQYVEDIYELPRRYNIKLYITKRVNDDSDVPNLHCQLDDDMIVYVPEGTLSYYTNHSTWTKYKNQISEYTTL